MNIDEIQTLVLACAYKPGWHIGFHPGTHPKDKPYVQISVDITADAAMDSTVRDGSKRVPWKSSKAHLSKHMCRQEIVAAVFGLIKQAETHEMHEWFRYRGASIYNPHLDPDVLRDVARKLSSFNVRENSMSMHEDE